jgi:hypothetical protein
MYQVLEKKWENSGTIHSYKLQEKILLRREILCIEFGLLGDGEANQYMFE